MALHITKQLLTICKPQTRLLSGLPKLKQTEAPCVISSRRPRLNHYLNMIYQNFDEIPLVSKGWNHSKSKGDSFTVKPVSTPDAQTIPLNSLNIDSKLIEALKKRNIETATDFQANAFSLFDKNKHLLLAAETGSGKTIAYLLPIICNLITNKTPKLNTPQALILVPNRELAYQVGEVAEALAESLLNVKIIVGGRTKKIMMNPEFGEVDILIGTPGALGKLCTVGVYKLEEVQFCVLDEADTLIDDSFVDRIVSIIRRMPLAKTILVSATMPKTLPEALKPIESNMEQLVSPKLHKPLLNITQKFMRITRSQKPSHLLQIAKSNKRPMMIFTNRNETCNWLAMFLRENGVSCANINGDMNYAIRIEQWNRFIRGETMILSATDVGSRGLDTTQVEHVLNYDFPSYAADYLHRIGRIGRLGSSKMCKATNFISGPEEVRLVQQIELAIRKNQPLQNVDGNITNIVQKKIQKGMRQAM
ncbi:ATP-dependent RNA helicase vasa, isoform A-like Protein [Tribolium castaneum]|uniref:ATP-dependent RNA helicase vasa, isoform A-like Protein n=2 Tax=Tribolium castaneum TaxID=7070 RepID=D2A2U5_TRICA|nr:ATP-dependent RNA helicase vasa, isoform A-like Protein [Tribolium castaneum]